MNFRLGAVVVERISVHQLILRVVRSLRAQLQASIDRNRSIGDAGHHAALLAHAGSSFERLEARTDCQTAQTSLRWSLINGVGIENKLLQEENYVVGDGSNRQAKLRQVAQQSNPVVCNRAMFSKK